MANYSDHEYWVKLVDSRLNDPYYDKPKYKLINTQLKVLRMQLVETMAMGLQYKGYMLSGTSAADLCKFIDFCSSFL